MNKKKNMKLYFVVNLGITMILTQFECYSWSDLFFSKLTRVFNQQEEYEVDII